MDGEITVTLDAAACGTHRDSHLKVPKDVFRAQVYPELPLKKRQHFDAGQPISMVFRDVDLIFKTQMMVDVTYRKSYCTVGRGEWWDYAQRKKLTLGSTLKLRYYPSVDEIHFIS